MKLNITLTVSSLLLGCSLFAPNASAFHSIEDSGDSDESAYVEEELEYEFTDEELIFLEWLDSQEDAFWNNGLFDYFVHIDDSGITTTTSSQEPDGEPTEGGKTKGEPVPQPTQGGPCVKKHSTKVQTTMWIDNFSAAQARKSFFQSKLLFPTNMHSVSRLAFNELLNSTNNLNDTGAPTEPGNWEDRQFRGSADLDIDIGINHGTISGLQATLSVRGGPEPTPAGTYHGTVKADFTQFHINDKKDKATIEYVMYGRPNVLSKVLFGTACAGNRKSEWIWQHVRVEITTDGCGGYDKKTTFLGESTFPSDSIFHDGVLQPGGRKQFDFTNLWLPICANHGAALAGACNYVSSADICLQMGNYLPPLPANPATHDSDASSM